MHTHIELNRYAVCLKLTHYKSTLGFPGDSVVKNPTTNAGDARDMGSIPGPGRSPGIRNSNPFQDSCLGNSMDRRARQATVPRVANSWTWLSTHIIIKKNQLHFNKNIKKKKWSWAMKAASCAFMNLSHSHIWGPTHHDPGLCPDAGHGCCSQGLKVRIGGVSQWLR